MQFNTMVRTVRVVRALPFALLVTLLAALVAWANVTLGGQPVVQPNGTVIVPIDNANETAVGAFRSTNGGQTWSSVVTIATISDHTVACGAAISA